MATISEAKVLLPMMGLFLTLGKIMPPLRVASRGVVLPPIGTVVAAPVLAGVEVALGLVLEPLGLLGLRAIQPLVTYYY